MNTVIAEEIGSVGIEEYLNQQQNKSLLRLLTCGSVDDGKSTLIGRLLHDSAQIYEDQLASLHTDSQKMGTTGEELDLALLVDGLAAEREQGITIDVAYRYFSTAKRKFIIADTPGHEQYTRNMATGASTCELAVILVDARYGVLTQTKRHSFIASLLGIKHFVVAINKMDLVEFSESRYEEIKASYLEFAKGLGERDIKFVPLSALKGDNVVTQSPAMPWYKEAPLLSILEDVQVQGELIAQDFRFPVQYVNRPNLNFRGFAGTISSGSIAKGDKITAQPSGKSSTVKSIVTFDGELESAFAGQAVTITLNDEIDISRGDVIVRAGAEAQLSNAFEANLVWMADDAMAPGRQYDFKLASKKTPGYIESIAYKVDVNTLEKSDAKQLELNEIASCTVHLEEQVAFDLYQDVRDTGGFIVIDRLTNVTVGAGMITKSATAKERSHDFSEFELEFNSLVRKHFPHWQALDITKLAE